VDTDEILAKLSTLDVLRWTYKESNEGEHLGSMAEEFYAAFGLGKEPHYISTVDADGVALAAIQALYARLLLAETEILRL
jgi:hypothetical protein